MTPSRDRVSISVVGVCVVTLFVSERSFDRRPVSDPLGGVRGWGQNSKGIANAATW